MKYKVLFLLFVVFLFSACLSQKSDQNEELGSLVEITGLIELGAGNKVCLVSDWESRSRVSHYIQKGKFYKKLEQNIGSYAEVKGYIRDEENNPFKKEIKVLKILSINKKAP